MSDLCRCDGDPDLARLQSLLDAGVSQPVASRIVFVHGGSWEAYLWAEYLRALADVAAAWSAVADLALEAAIQ